MSVSANRMSINIGLVGLGRFGRLHARILDRVADSRLIAACDPDPASQQWGRDLGIPTVVPTFDELLALADLDAIFLVSPEDLHAGQALASLDRNLPVFMEKPLATSLEDARAVVDKVSKSGGYAQVGFVLRFDAQHALVRQAIDSGSFGEVVTFRAKRNNSAAWFPDYGEREPIVYLTMIHDIDLAVWLTGSKAERVFAVGRNVTGHQFPDAVMATLQMANGALVQLETSWLMPSHAPRNVMAGDWIGTIDAEFELVGTKSSAQYRLLDSGVAISSSDPVYRPETALWPEIYGQIGGALRLEDEHFIDCVRSGRPSPIASLTDALHGLEIADAIMRSLSSGDVIHL